MRKLTVVLGALMLFCSTGVASAVTINYASGPDGTGGFTTLQPTPILETFDAASPFTWSGDYSIIKGTTTQHSAPFGLAAKDTTFYIATPLVLGGPTPDFAKATWGGVSNYLGLWWGSVDAYNSIRFYMGNSLVATVTGNDVLNPNPANGNQSSPTTNTYVNIFDLPSFNSFQLVSSGYAFEADNIAVNVVPEPGTMMLLGAGFLGLAVWGKRRKNA